MSATKIEWADKVWNPVTGCTPVSAGCEHCYAQRMANRLRGQCGYSANEPFGVTVHLRRFDEPLYWKKPSRIFVCSMGDLFHDDVPSSDIVDVFAIMERAKWHTCCVLTKRPRRMHKLLSSWEIYEAPPNIWLGVSVEDQKATDERIPILLQAPAALRFVSVEPMLGPVDLECVNREGCWHTDALCRGDDAHIDWVICGGETGPGARPMHPDWARSLRDQCQAAGVPFFFKGWGDTILLPNGRDVSRLRGRKYRELDGRTWDEVPEVSPDRNLVC